MSFVTFENNLSFIALAIVICFVGSIVSLRLFDRGRLNKNSKRIHWIFLAGITGGCTIWTTQFVAMVGLAPQIKYGFEPVTTAISLFVTIGMCLLGFTVSAWTRKSFWIEVGGGIVGLSAVLMHHLGHQAHHVARHMDLDDRLVVISAILGVFFGAFALSRAARPVRSYCRYCGPILLVLAIFSVHFSDLSALGMSADSLVEQVPGTVSTTTLLVCVIGVMVLILGSGFSINILESHQRAETQEYFHRLSQHDAVTGLPSYEFMQHQNKELLRETEENGLRIAVLAIRLEGLREIRKVQGLAVSDHVLNAMITRLETLFGYNEVIAKGRGNKLIICMFNVWDKKQVKRFARRLEVEFRQPFQVGDFKFKVDFRCGVAFQKVDSRKSLDLLSHAELALDRAEHAKTCEMVFYDRKIDENHLSRSALSMELRHAIERDEFKLFYQPQIDVASGNLIGFEVLLRWFHPERGLVSPDEFIPIAEESGLIIPIGEWVLRTACAESAKWTIPYKIAVNVASAQLSTNELPIINLDVLGKTGLDAKRLEIEITETSIIEDHRHTLNIVRQLKQLGISIAMDDFGTGYSSLSMLQIFPFDKIKVDRSFITGVSKNEQSSDIARATIFLAKGLQMKTLAEGVEDTDDLEFLRNHGCEEAQGITLASLYRLKTFTPLSMPITALPPMKSRKKFFSSPGGGVTGNVADIPAANI